jgi:2-(1,2-epoxy-1,2-dihydrophenyl)acetyl-CoA isomerase
VEENLRVWTCGPVRWIAPDRAAKLNAWTYEMAARFTEEFAQADDDDAVEVIVLAGSAGAFSAGLDRDALAQGIRPTPFDVEGFIKSRTPTIACVDGIAFGMGASTALACDLRVASTRARFVFGYVRVGLSPEWGTSYLLSRQVGLSRALDLCLTGRAVEAEEAFRIGLVDRLVEPDELTDVTQELAESIAAQDTAAVRRSKAGLWASYEAPTVAEARVIERTALLQSGLARP